MYIFYHPQYNIDLGFLNRLHPFDGKKFEKVYNGIKNLPDIEITSIEEPISQDIINEFVDDLLKLLLPQKKYILGALELPNIPVLSHATINKRILLPMRWATAGTLAATKMALEGRNVWNLGGGYHHASHQNSEGFCIYNDIGIAYMELLKQGFLQQEDKILIVDIDAHHGNGNALSFYDNENISILDIYNNDIYPQDDFSKSRINYNIPLKNGTEGMPYLRALLKGLSQLSTGFKLAYVIAGTDVIYTDPLGGLKLTVEECVARDQIVFDRLKELSIPTVFLGGGGYSKHSGIAITKSISNLYTC